MPPVISRRESVGNLNVQDRHERAEHRAPHAHPCLEIDFLLIARRHSTWFGFSILAGPILRQTPCAEAANLKT